MDANRKKLIQLRAKLSAYKNFEEVIDKVLNGTIEAEDLSGELYSEVRVIESELDDLKMEMNLDDDQWDEDEE